MSSAETTELPLPMPLAPSAARGHRDTIDPALVWLWYDPELDLELKRRERGGIQGGAADLGPPPGREVERQATVASANGSTADAPARRSSRPATVIVQRLSTRSSTSSTGPSCDCSAAPSSGPTVKVSHTPLSR